MKEAVKTFREACCNNLAIPPEAYEETVLFQCLPARHKPVGKLMWRINRSYFEPDLKLLQAVADCTSLREIHTELSYHHDFEPESGIQRKVLKARMSGQLLINLASKLLAAK